jgi:hypothetical protein
MGFFDDVKVTAIKSGTTEGALAGAFDGTANPVDMAGFDGVAFVCQIAKVVTTTSGVNMYAMASCSSGATFHAIAGTAVQCGSSGTNQYIGIDISKPLPEHRWIGPYAVVPATCTWIGGIMAYQYKGRSLPVTQPATTSVARTISVISATSG